MSKKYTLKFALKIWLKNYCAGSVCNPGMAVAEAEVRQSDKHRDLINVYKFLNQWLLKFRVPPTLAPRVFEEAL